MMNDDTVSLDVAIDSDEQYWGMGFVNYEVYLAKILVNKKHLDHLPSRQDFIPTWMSKIVPRP